MALLQVKKSGTGNQADSASPVLEIARLDNLAAHSLALRRLDKSPLEGT
jgi:hypothetical protein